MSERVRRAMALDDVEELVVKRCAEDVEEAIRTTKHLQVRLGYNIVGAVEHVADKHGVEFGWLWPESLKMLRKELNRAIGGLRNNHEYIRPLEEGGRTVGLTVNFYMFDRSAA